MIIHELEIYGLNPRVFFEQLDFPEKNDPDDFTAKKCSFLARSVWIILDPQGRLKSKSNFEWNPWSLNLTKIA